VLRWRRRRSPDDGAGGDVQRRQQRGRAVTFVVVGLPLGNAWRQRQRHAHMEPFFHSMKPVDDRPPFKFARRLVVESRIASRSMFVTEQTQRPTASSLRDRGAFGIDMTHSFFEGAFRANASMPQVGRVDFEWSQATPMAPLMQDGTLSRLPSHSEIPPLLPLGSLEAQMIAAMRLEANGRRRRVEGLLESPEAAALLLATFGRGMAVGAAVLGFAPALQRELDTLVRGIDRRFKNDREIREPATEITAPAVAQVVVQARGIEPVFCIGGVPVERRARARG
jgi:hypothetical protein